MRRLLRRRSTRPGPGPRENLRAAAARLVEHRDFGAPWRREPLDRAGAIDAVVARLEELAPLAAGADDGEDWLARSLAEIAHWVAENRLRERVRGRDHDSLEASLRGLAPSKAWRWKGYGRRYGPDLDRAEVIARRDAAKAALDEMLAAAEADLAACLREDLRPVIDAYGATKARHGKLDFLDLLMRARDLVAQRPDVRRELQARFTHFFVDEFQDTDPLQVELLMLLCSAAPAEADHLAARPVPGKLFIVGDPKQSIYRFRRADVALYEGAKRRLVEAGAEVLHLTTSFRGVPSIQAAVNGAFEAAMKGDAPGQAAYVALERYRPEPQGRPTVVALPVPRPYGIWGRVTWRAIDASLPGAVGAFVAWLVRESGWTVAVAGPDGAPAQVPVEARHVCILFRRFQSFGRDVTRPYVDALEERRVPHVLVGGRSFHAREEVLAIRNALTAVEWPDDSLRVFATLRGPLFALGDDDLFAYRALVGPLHPLAPVDADGLEASDRAVAEALAILGALHRGRNRRPIAETVSRLLAAVRAHAGIAIWRNGEQALANCLRVADRARRFEGRGAASFRGFVEALEGEAKTGDVEQAPIVEEGTAGVRIMTVHKAKGLEFPVVIRADPRAPATHTFPAHHLDPDAGLWAETLCGAAPHDLRDHLAEGLAADAAEATRVAYVAATRARDLLVVPAFGDGPEAGWFAVLNPALYPDPGHRQLCRRTQLEPIWGYSLVYI
ncbi:MAG: UvrD-helicase domain-containing protein, partial [Anaerolineae bacterium]